MLFPLAHRFAFALRASLYLCGLCDKILCPIVRRTSPLSVIVGFYDFISFSLVSVAAEWGKEVHEKSSCEENWLAHVLMELLRPGEEAREDSAEAAF